MIVRFMLLLNIAVYATACTLGGSEVTDGDSADTEIDAAYCVGWCAILRGHRASSSDDKETTIEVEVDDNG